MEMNGGGGGKLEEVKAILKKPEGDFDNLIWLKDKKKWLLRDYCRRVNL